jgi:hypothetical protein
MGNLKVSPQHGSLNDVADPNTSMPSSSAKPIIVTHRPMMSHDPMVSDAPVDAPAISEATHAVKPVKIKPLNEDTAHVTAAARSEAPSIVDVIAKQTNSPTPVTELAALSPQPTTVPEKPVSATIADPVHATDQDKAVSINQPIRTPDPDGKPAQPEIYIEPVFDTKEYYLPINIHDTHKGTQMALIALAVVIVLAVVWLDIALDAGIIKLGGLQPLTHFFHH